MTIHIFERAWVHDVLFKSDLSFNTPQLMNFNLSHTPLTYIDFFVSYLYAPLAFFIPASRSLFLISQSHYLQVINGPRIGCDCSREREREREELSPPSGLRVLRPHRSSPIREQPITPSAKSAKREASQLLGTDIQNEPVKAIFLLNMECKCFLNLLASFKPVWHIQKNISTSFWKPVSATE